MHSCRKWCELLGDTENVMDSSQLCSPEMLREKAGGSVLIPLLVRAPVVLYFLAPPVSQRAAATRRRQKSGKGGLAPGGTGVEGFLEAPLAFLPS